MSEIYNGWKRDALSIGSYSTVTTILRLRWPSSAERYKQVNDDEVKELLEKFHLMA